MFLKRSRAPHTTIRTLAALVLLTITLATLTTGCKADACQQMTRCCAEVKTMKGVGTACTKLTAQTRDPQTCHSVVQTVNFMLQDRKKPIPAACVLPKQ